MLFCNAQKEDKSILNNNIEQFKVIDKSLKETFQKLSNQYNINIGYSIKKSVFSKKTTINVKNKTVKEVLNKLLLKTNYIFKAQNNKVLIYKKRTKKSKDTYTISGYIKEKGSQEHLFGVSVYIPKLGIGTSTNTYGFYSLTVPKGDYTLLISSVGFISRSKKINLHKNILYSVEIELKEEYLDEVIVSSEKIIKQSQTTQMSFDKLKMNNVKDLPAFLGETDVLKTLQLLPGVESGVEATSGVYIRGGSPDQNLIILDEAQVYNSNHLFGLFSIFNGDGIKSVEVFKGGFPARFGGRLSSVININMKDGNKEKLVGKFSIGLLSSSVMLEGPISKRKTSFHINARRTYADLISLPFQPKNSTVGYYFQDLNFKIHHVFNDKNKLFWSNYYGKDNFSSLNEKNTNRDKRNINWGNITSTLRWNHEFNNKLFSNTSVIFSNYDFNVNSESKNTSIETKFITSSGINDYGIKTDFQYIPNPKHRFQFGLTGTYHNFTPQRLNLKETGVNEISKNQELNSIESAIYVEDTWKVSKRLSMTPGMRISNFNHKATNYTAFEPRIGIAWKATPTISLKTSYSKMNQYIHLLTNSGFGLPTDLWVSSTDKVKPQQSEQIAIGAIKDFEDSEYSFSIEAYYKKMNDIISYKEGASFLVLNNLQSGKNVSWEENITEGQGWAYGSEFLFKKERGKLTGWLSYTISKSERQFDELNLGRKFNSKYDRRHSLSLVGIYKLSKNITLSGNWSFSSGLSYTLPNLKTSSPDNEFPILSPPNDVDNSYGFTTERNNFKGEAFHRLDLSIQFHKKTKRNNLRTWAFSIYNGYGNRNPLFYFVSNSDTSFNTLGGNTNSVNDITLRRYSLLVFVPSITYTLKF